MFEIVLNILQQKTPALFLSALQRLLLNWRNSRFSEHHFTL